jgi:predicted acylesterase/phospholipase RssA
MVLAGGGMRVAWQAGALLALDEAGVAFDHYDGTSGGIMNAAAVVSGTSPADLCERWVTLPVRRFASPLPLRRYLAAPNLLAWGDARGLTGTVFPHLGIDVDALHAARHPTATFNVCRFDDKVSVAVPNHEVALEHLVAGVSLPIAMPPVHHDGATWTDAVWIRDANLTEAVRRGAAELWLAWCIGNTPRYRRGPLDQYVHMIEMSAAGSLNVELAQLAESNRAGADPVRLHVVKPRHPLPLDPELFSGRIDAHTLVAMGHRDACRYLAARSDDGVTLDPTATQMLEPPLGVRFRDGARGTVGSTDVELRLGAELHGIEGPEAADDALCGDLAGSVRLDDGARRYLSDGTVEVRDGALHYEGTFTVDGAGWRLSATRALGLGAGLDLVLAPDEAARTATGGRHGGTAGHLAGDRRTNLRAITSLEPSGADGVADRARAVRRALAWLRHRS